MKASVVLALIAWCLIDRVVLGFVLDSRRHNLRRLASKRRSRFQSSPINSSSFTLLSFNNDEKSHDFEDIEDEPAASDQFAHLVESNPFDDAEPRKRKQSLPPMPSVKLVGFRGGESKLNPYNIPTNPDEEWEWFFAKLKARNEDGVVSNAVQESLLRNWMANQRKSFMKTLGVLDIGAKTNWGTEYLTLVRKQRLDEVGFNWGHLQPGTLTNDLIYSDEFQRKVRLNYKDWIWNPMYEKLCHYYKDHGNTTIPLSSSDGLGVWTARQRLIRWEMPARRRERLDEINFEWDWKDESMPLPRKPVRVKVGRNAPSEGIQRPKTVPFSRRLGQLKEYRIANGDCNVPLDYENGLGKWVKRMKRRKSKLSPRSVIKLEKLGLQFDPEETDDDKDRT